MKGTCFSGRFRCFEGISYITVSVANCYKTDRQSFSACRSPVTTTANACLSFYQWGKVVSYTYGVENAQNNNIWLTGSTAVRRRETKWNSSSVRSTTARQGTTINNTARWVDPPTYLASYLSIICTHLFTHLPSLMLHKYTLCASPAASFGPRLTLCQGCSH